MARRKGGKVWDGVTREEWLAFFADPEVMTELMLRMFSVLYHTPGHAGRAKHIAAVLGMEYRGLNAAVGWAGLKIRAWDEQRREKNGHEALVQESLAESGAAREASLLLEDGPAEAAALAPEREERAPWEYVFDGAEETDGTYLWILKPAAVSAWREMEEADWPLLRPLRRVLAEDVSAAGPEESLFARPPAQTVREIRDLLAQDRQARERAREQGGCCAVCGLARASLLRAVSYGNERQRGLLLCPTHAALFTAHLISFGPAGQLLISASLPEADRAAMGLAPGMKARGAFSGRRMMAHRRIFREQERRMP